MVRYPLGGNLSWTLQWLVGFQRLGHDVYLVEKSGYPDACFDPVRNVTGDDCSHGISVVAALLERFGLAGRWCFVDQGSTYHGLSRRAIEDVFAGAALFVDIGTHGAWLPEARTTEVTAYVDGEPGSTQMKWAGALAAGRPLLEYDLYYSNGASIGTPQSAAPDVGIEWRPLYNPVVPALFELPPAKVGAPFTTVMNWQAHASFVYAGTAYRQKDVEFERFLELPRRAGGSFEVSVSGGAPREELARAGWKVRRGHDVTASYDAYLAYIERSLGEFSVCKHVYVATNSGWFSDRSGAYLAAGRPVVLQETGFSAHLPCGEGLFAVRDVDEAVAAVDAIRAHPDRHSRAAKEIAREHLDARVILGRLLADAGI
ncbi:MAG: glycosyltransferase [Gaiellaceae bacterium]